MEGKLHQWLHILVFVLLVRRTESTFVDISYVQNAVAKGAVCLDGSPSAYHLDRGSGAGINNWLIHLEGGGWCNNVTSCLLRTKNLYGSSNHMAKQIKFSGIFSNQAQSNPDFYNWNRVKIRYCDGSSFTSDIEAVNPATKLFYRGARIFRVVMEELLEKGLKCAPNAILAGCSSGGVASILHCDSFRALLPSSTKVKCLADAGFFINVKDIAGQHHIRNYFNEIVTTHESAKNLPKSCTSKMNASLCFFPQYVVEAIQTPLFIINSDIDTWQIYNILVPGVVDPSDRWHNCKINLNKCSATQLHTIQGFGEEFVNVVTGLGASTSRGYFINSCFTHCQAEFEETWFTYKSPKLGNKRMAEAVIDWFFDRSPFRRIGCLYPCDKTCNNTFLSLQGYPPF